MITTNTDFSQVFNEATTAGIRYPFVCQLNRKINDVWTAIDCEMFNCTITKGSIGDNEFSIGAVFVPYIEMTVSSDANISKDEEYRLDIGIKPDADTTHWITIGYFTAEKPDVGAVRTSFKAVGRIEAVLNKRVFETSTDKTVANILSSITSETGINFVHSNVNLNVTIPSTRINGKLMRDVLLTITTFTGTYITETNDGNIRIFKYNTDSYIDYDGNSMNSQPTFADADFVLDGLKVIKSESYEDENGQTVAEVSFTTTVPPVATLVNSDATQTIFNVMCSNLGITNVSGRGFNFRPGNANLILGDPRLEPFDTVRITVDDENFFIMPCMNIVHSYTGGFTTSISATGITDDTVQQSTGGSITQQLENIHYNLLTFGDAIGKRLVVEDLTAEGGKISNSTILGSLIKDGTIDGTKIVDSTITGSKIQDSAITNSKILNGTIEGAKIANSTLTGANIIDATIGSAKIQNVDVEKLTGGTIDVSHIDTDSITTEVLNSTALKTTYATIANLDAEKARIDNLNANKADIHLAEVDVADVGTLLARSGMITDFAMHEGYVTGKLSGVIITGDVIAGNTIRADSLLVQGENGLYYKLNVDALGEATASSDPKYQNGLDGSAIVVDSITTDKIHVTDLESFKATIGGFKLTESSIYSVNESIILNADGSLSLGNGAITYDPSDENPRIVLGVDSVIIGGKPISVIPLELIDYYYLSTSATSLVGGEWSTDIPTWENGKYIWKKTKTVKASGESWSDPVNITGAKGETGAQGIQGVQGEKGADGTSVTVSSIKYATTTTSTKPSTINGSFPTTLTKGTYLWSRTTYSDGSTADAVTYLGTDGDITEAVNQAKAIVDAIEVGGRNLLLNSSLENANPSSSTVSDDGYGGAKAWEIEFTGWTSGGRRFPELRNVKFDSAPSLQAGDKVTMSGWLYIYDDDLDPVYPTGSTIFTRIYYEEGGSIDVQLVIDYNLERGVWHKVSHTVTIAKKPIQSSDSGNHKPKLQGGIYNAHCKFSNLKIEKGNKPTDWTPAPEDVDGAIEEASQTASKYITEVTEGGISVHRDGNLTSGVDIADTVKVKRDSNNYAEVDADGMKVIQDGVERARFGASTKLVCPVYTLNDDDEWVETGSESSLKLSGAGVDIYNGRYTGLGQTYDDPQAEYVGGSLQAYTGEIRLSTYNYFESEPEERNYPAIEFNEKSGIHTVTNRLYMDSNGTLNTEQFFASSMDTQIPYYLNGQPTLHVIPHVFSSSATRPTSGWTTNTLGNYMSASHFLHLKEKVSDQQNGLIFLWSAYTSSTIRDYNFNYFFVPKWHVEMFPGSGVHQNIFNSDFSYACSKYIYIHDTYINGNDKNHASGTGSTGIKYDNTKYVLRQVLGF